MMRETRDRVILITGATDGLGKRVAHDLAWSGATLLLHGRSPEKGRAVVREIEAATGNRELLYYNADFSSLEAVRRLAEEVTADRRRLDVLINNAGIGVGSHNEGRELSSDGFELRFAVNYLAPFLLTHRLLPLLQHSAPARVVNVSSVGQQPIDFGDVMLERSYDGLRAYRQSKLAQIMFTIDLAERLKGTGVTVNCLHPATLMNTKMVLDTDYFMAPMTTVEQGASAVDHLATSPELVGVTGEYFDGRRPSRANRQAYDEEARRRLWLLSERLTGLAESRPATGSRGA